MFQRSRLERLPNNHLREQQERNLQIIKNSVEKAGLDVREELRDRLGKSKLSFDRQTCGVSRRLRLM